MLRTNLPSAPRAVFRALFVTALCFGLGCGSKTVRTGAATAAARPDAAGTGTGAPDDSCLVFVGDEQRGPGQICVCASDCTTGTCEQGICCTGAACGAKRPDGTPCGDGTLCASGFCADGVCCNVACTGACLACNQPELKGECAPVGAGVDDPHQICRQDAPDTCGQSGVCNGQGGCAKYPADTICQLGLCNANGQFVPPGTCDGDGTCVAGVAISCSPSKCIGSECTRICTGDDQCVAGKSCLAGSCGKFGPGQTCERNDQCESAFCVDGVCCENACTGACQTCGSPMSRGKCVPVAAGVSDAACPLSPVASCGSNGKCDGKGACASYDNNTICRPARCDAAANTATPAARCNGGACPAANPRNCAPFQGCNGNACLSTCGSDAQCVGTNVCTGGSCGKRGDGGRCNNNSDCDSGTCAQGFCCATACNGLCKSCGLPGQQGICADVPVGGADPSGRCRDDACNNECNGQGGCRREPAGTTCAAATCAGMQRTTFTCTAAGECAANTTTCGAPTPVCKPDGCAPPDGKGPGEQCVKGADCRGGLFCVASGGTNICCTQPCGGPCQQCAASGTGCVAKPDGQSCGINSSCDGGTCCPVGTNKCGALCVNLNTSPGNCGMCGHACGANAQCIAGACVPITPVCLPPRTMCPSGCTNLNNDEANCKTCGNKCPAGQSCIAGTCTPPMCPPAQTMCPDGCKNLNNDEANCRTCGNKCPAGQNCIAGTCTPPRICLPPRTMCPSGCTNLNNDEANCGKCGFGCPAGQTCQVGMCKPPTCPGNQTMCNGVCTNLNNDETNCGKCGVACAKGEVCRAGVCGGGPGMCPPGRPPCGGVCCPIVRCLAGQCAGGPAN